MLQNQFSIVEAIFEAEATFRSTLLLRTSECFEAYRSIFFNWCFKRWPLGYIKSLL